MEVVDIDEEVVEGTLGFDILSLIVCSLRNLFSARVRRGNLLSGYSCVEVVFLVKSG